MTEFSEVSNPPTDQHHIGEVSIDLEQALSLPPEEVYQDVITGKESGHPISIFIGSHDIKIIDMKNIFFHFCSTFQNKIDPEDKDHLTNSISFDIRTVDRNKWNDEASIKHPDFRALQLAQDAMTYFEARYGQIREIDFFWEGPKTKEHKPASDNYLQYQRKRRELLEKLQIDGVLEEQAVKQAEQLAALSTWTGRKLATPRGLTCVRGLEEYWAVTGTFVKAGNES